MPNSRSRAIRADRVRRERGILAPGAIERQHELLPEPLPRRVLRDEVLQGHDERVRAPAGQLGVRPGLQAGQALAAEGDRADGSELEVLEVGERLSTPQVEPFGQRLGRRIMVTGGPEPGRSCRARQEGRDVSGGIERIPGSRVVSRWAA